MGKEPILVILAAGMGSRYGGLKQMDSMDPYGNVIIDYSMYDAKRAGFNRVIFIIKKENEEIFKKLIGDRACEHFEVQYAFQSLDDIPKGIEVPEGREKPWGTSHALYACRDIIDAPFAVINADDYYGIDAFEKLYKYLKTYDDPKSHSYSMMGYILKNTVTEHGSVARGVCESKNGKLVEIIERTHIEKVSEDSIIMEEEGERIPLDPESVVSMNMWGFTESIIEEIGEHFEDFLKENLPKNPLKCEYFIPTIIETLLKENKCEVEVLTSKDRWFGVTYKEDKPAVEKAFADMKKNNLYPEKLWR